MNDNEGIRKNDFIYEKEYRKIYQKECNGINSLRGHSIQKHNITFTFILKFCILI